MQRSSCMQEIQHHYMIIYTTRRAHDHEPSDVSQPWNAARPRAPARTAAYKPVPLSLEPCGLGEPKPCPIAYI